MTCDHPGCHRKAHARGLCKTHYEHQRRDNPTTVRYHIVDNVGRWRDFAPYGPWADRAACLGATELFFEPYTNRPGAPDRAANRRIAKAIATCQTCPVIRECRQWALTEPDPVVGGVAGGLTTHQREQIRTRRTA